MVLGFADSLLFTKCIYSVWLIDKKYNNYFIIFYQIISLRLKNIPKDV